MMNPQLMGMMADDRTRELLAMAEGRPSGQLPTTVLRRRARAARRLLRAGSRRR